VKVDLAGNSDRINVTGGGSATINGGTVDVRATNGAHAPTTVYTILNAPGGVTGTFNGVTSNLAVPRRDAGVRPNNVRLRLTRNNISFASVAATPDQVAVARNLDQVAQRRRLWA
jgi:uncharacterized protein with beta-barrel porin domain